MIDDNSLPMARKNKVIIFDGNNLFFSCYAANETINSNNVHIGGIIGSLASLQKICIDVKPHEIFVVWDGKGSSNKRKNLNENYKQGRVAPKPYKLNRNFQYENEEQEAQNRRWQQARFIDILNYCPVTQIIESGVEADDIISWMTRNYNHDGINIIYSNDKDYLQLVNDNTIVYRFTKKVFMTKQDVIDEYDVMPSNMALARAIEGDKSDNLIGVNRVGLKILNRYFPELKQKEDITFDQFFEMANKKYELRKELNCLKNIVESRQLIEDNYKIMQLYAPLIDAKTSISIENTIKEKKLGFSLTAFNLQIMKDGMRYSDFINLCEHFGKIVNHSKFKE